VNKPSPKKPARKKPATYEGQIAELEEIIAEIEEGNLSIDELGEKVKRASVLIRNCRAVLKKTEDEVRDILSGLKDE